MFLSKLGYSELVQRLFEKLHFFVWTPYKDVKLEPLAHLPEAIHGRLSALHVAICCIAICRVAICRVAISQWVLHAFVISVANGKRVQTNNQFIIGGALLEEAKEGHCCILMVACVVQDGGDAFVMDNGNAIGQRTATQ